jgi:hypothetical protein
MATIDCPRGCRWISRRGNLTLEFRDVDIFNGVCDHSDRCDLRDCEYFDDTPQGTRKYLEGLCHSRTLDGANEDQRLQAVLRAKHKLPSF